MTDQQEKKPAAKRLGSLNTGLGRSDGRLGSLRSADGAGPSSQPAARGATAPRKMRFAPTNFARVRKAEESPDSTDVTSASKSEGQFEDLMKAAQNEASWQRRRGRGGGAAPGRGHTTVTTFGGGAGDVQRRRPTAREVSGWGGRGRGASAASGPHAGKQLEDGKTEDGDVAEAMLKDEDLPECQDLTGTQESDSQEEAAPADPLDYQQYYPTILPMCQPGMARADEGPGDEGPVPPDILTLPEEVHLQQRELEFLRDIESNDGRLMLFQLPSALPIPIGTAAVGGGGAAVVDSRPASLSELPATRIGKLLVFESGAIKMQIGDVLLDVAPGVPCQFRQDVAVVNPNARHCVLLAPVAQRVVCSPDLETLLSDDPLPDWPRALGVSAKERAQRRREDEAGGPAAMQVDGGNVANGTEAASQQHQQQVAVNGKVEVKEEPEVNSPRARGVPRNRKQHAAAAGGEG